MFQVHAISSGRYGTKFRILDRELNALHVTEYAIAVLALL